MNFSLFSHRVWAVSLLSLLPILPQAARAMPPQLRVAGPQLQTEAGQVVRLQGVNVPSLEWSNEGDHLLQSLKVALEDWKSNCIRLPLAQDRWFGKAPNQDDGGAAYRQLVEEVVKTVADHDAYVVLDLHWSDAGAWGRYIGQHSMPDENSEAFWLLLSGHFANHPAVLFDLYNEPKDVSWEVWKSGGEVKEKVRDKVGDGEQERDISYRTPGLQKLIDIIRAGGARNVIVAGGLDWGYDLSGVLKGFDLADPNGRGVLYGSHVYPWKGGPDNWKTHFGDIAKLHPIFVGEIGADPKEKRDNTEDGLTWSPKILQYINDNGLSWTGWCFHTDASPRMLLDWNYTPSPFWGQFAKTALQDAAQKRNTGAR